MVLVAAIAVAATAATHVARMLTLTPTSVDYGKAGAPAGYALRQITVSTDVVGELLTLSLTGPHAGHFRINHGGDLGGTAVLKCADEHGAVLRVCPFGVDFRPLSMGIKTATFTVTNARGQRASASLRGEGVAEFCELKVVSCNYAHLYSGTFSWKIDLRDADTRTSTNVTVNVIKGVAACSGAFHEIDPNVEPIHGTISGPGLIGVEFLSDPVHPLAARIVVACPSTQQPGVPSQPATLGNTNTMDSDRQPAQAIGVNLSGTINYPAPESDPVNGISGTVQVTWDLKRWCPPGTTVCP